MWFWRKFVSKCESKAHPYKYISIITSCVNIIIVMHTVCFAALVSVTVSNAMPRMTGVSSGWNEVAHNCGWQNTFYVVQHAGRHLPKFSRLTWLDDTADSDRFRPGQFSRTSVLLSGFVTLSEVQCGIRRHELRCLPLDRSLPLRVSYLPAKIVRYALSLYQWVGARIHSQLKTWLWQSSARGIILRDKRPRS